MPFAPDLIVVDSNVLISDYWLRNPSALLLEAFIRRTNSKLIVPRVVVEEVKNKHNQHIAVATENFRTAAKKITDANRKLVALLGIDSQIDIQEPDANKSYAQFLDDRLKTLRAIIVDYAGVTQASVVSRAISKKRPFRSDDKGYRDTLLWEAILSLCSPDVRIAFITNDAEAFCLADTLHPDLQDDLKAISVPPDRFRVFKNLPAFTEESALPFLTQERDYVTLIKSGNLDGLDIAEEIDHNVDVISDALNSRPALMRDDSEYSEPTVTGVYGPRDINISEASEASDKILVVSLDFSSDINYSFFLDRTDSFSLEEDEHVVDWDWNEHTSRVETTRSFRISALIAFNLEEREVESFEVEDVKREWRSWRNY